MSKPFKDHDQFKVLKLKIDWIQVQVKDKN